MPTALGAGPVRGFAGPSAVGLAGRGRGRAAGAQDAQVRRVRTGVAAEPGSGAAGRGRAEPQHQVAGVADHPAEDGDQPPPPGGHGRPLHKSACRINSGQHLIGARSSVALGQVP